MRPSNTTAENNRDERPPRTIFLVGLSGTGKSTVGRLLAERLGLPFVDTDAEIEGVSGRTVPELFAAAGEPAFRALEREVVAQAAHGEAAVVATGGGAVLDARNQDAMRSAGLVAWLDATVETLVSRLQAMESHGRPLLEGDPHAALARLDGERRATYAAIGRRIDASGSVEDVLQQLLTIVERPREPASNKRAGETEPIWVRAPSQTYPVYVASGLLEQAADLLARHGLTTRLHVVADARIDALHGDRLRAGLQDAAYTWHVTPAGEEHKNIETVIALYDALLGERPERRDVIVAFGGGVIGDLVGFVAATLLRGMRFAQIPTTVLSQVDSSVGGKVGFDHPRGKNLIGAFHQPSLVLADLDVLRTLPSREIAAGWAEVVKIAVVQDAALFADLEASVGELTQLTPLPTQRAICRAIELKARLVEQDERDTTGVRAVLNYGHTIGHALEAATGYEALLHGEGVAIGMAAAAYIAGALGLHPAEAIERQRRLLDRLGLPSRSENTPRDAVVTAIGLDKKREGSRTTWILPAGLGDVRVTSDVPQSVVDEAIDLVIDPGPLDSKPLGHAPEGPSSASSEAR